MTRDAGMTSAPCETHNFEEFEVFHEVLLTTYGGAFYHWSALLGLPAVSTSTSTIS